MPDKTPIQQHASNQHIPEDLTTIAALSAELSSMNSRILSTPSLQVVEREYEAFMQRRNQVLGVVRKAIQDRRDSAQNPSINNATSKANPQALKTVLSNDDSDKNTPSLTSAETLSTEQTIKTPPPATQDEDYDDEMNDGTLIGYAGQVESLKEEALELHLSAWFARLGPPDGLFWTQHSPKSTTLACITLRELLEKGDADTDLGRSSVHPFNKERWMARIRKVNFRFGSYATAVDFLSFQGIGKNRFGSGIVQILASRWVNAFRDSRCQSTDHAESMLNYHSVHRRHLPSTPCGCVQELLLWERFAGANWGAADAFMQNDAARYSEVMKIDVARALAVKERVFRKWELFNFPGCPEGCWSKTPWSQPSKPISLNFVGKKFQFQWMKKKEDDQQVGLHSVVVTGPFAELL